MIIDYKNLPILPEILSEAVLHQVFTHRSLYGRPGHQFEDNPNDPSPDNESLEHLGDSVLGFIITNLIRTMYPNIHVGPATKIRSRMVENTTLAALAVYYKMPELLRGHSAQIFVLRQSVNVQGDLFEAYIAGVYLTRGLDVTANWLETLFKPLVENAYNHVRSNYYGYDNSAGLSYSQQSETESTDSTDSSSPISVHPPNSSQETSRPRNTPAGYLMLFNEYLVKNKLSVEWIWESEDNTGSAGLVMGWVRSETAKTGLVWVWSGLKPVWEPNPNCDPRETRTSLKPVPNRFETGLTGSLKPRIIHCL